MGKTVKFMVLRPDNLYSPQVALTRSDRSTPVKLIQWCELDGVFEKRFRVLSNGTRSHVSIACSQIDQRELQVSKVCDWTGWRRKMDLRCFRWFRWWELSRRLISERCAHVLLCTAASALVTTIYLDLQLVLLRLLKVWWQWRFISTVCLIIDWVIGEISLWWRF